MKLRKFVFCLALISKVSLVHSQALTDRPSVFYHNNNGNPNDRRNQNSGSWNLRSAEYVAGEYPGAVMIPINVWGSTKSTGLFKVPKTTTLIELLSYAQGPSADAKLSKVKVKRTAEKIEKTFTVDVEELIENPAAHDIPLMANDVVYVEPRKPFLDPQIVTTVSVLATVATLISTVFIIRNSSK